MENGIELSITGINLLKDNKKGAVLIQHYKTQTAKLEVHAQSIQETGSVQMIEHMVISGVSLSDKLRAQVLHYLRTGEVFDSVRSAMENGAVSIIIQPSVVYEEEVVHMLSSIQTYNEESRNDSAEVLYPTVELSTDSNIGIASQFLDPSLSF